MNALRCLTLRLAECLELAAEVEQHTFAAFFLWQNFCKGSAKYQDTLDEDIAHMKFVMESRTMKLTGN